MKAPILIAAALAATVSSPALAQVGAPADGVRPHARLFRHMGRIEGMSPDGVALMKKARASARDEETRAQIEALRTQALDVLGADRLDAGRLERLMREERNLAHAQQQRLQSAMLSAYTQLSAADRKAWVANARQVQTRVADAMAIARKWRSERAAAPVTPGS